MTSLNLPDPDLTKPVQLKQGVYWVGIFLDNDPFQCHPYFIENGDHSILIDPGSMIQKQKIIEKIQMVTDLKNIHYIILHHQDPDLCAAVPDLERLINRDDLTIVTHSRMSVLIKHYGIQAPYYNIDENDFHLNCHNIELSFYTTPYLHSPGAFVTYLPEQKILFSGDLFGGLEDNWSFYAQDDYFKQIEGFHMSYMPSRDILNYSLNKIDKLDLDTIAPQHGSIITKDKIHSLLQDMKQMHCGLYIDSEYSQNLKDTIDELHETRTELENSLDTVTELKKKQDGDYFLTNLLQKPLMKNYNKSKRVGTHFVLYQYKKFQFKQKNLSIGGDLCITGNLIFQGEPYTMFFNGDSMGKSIQGAGGSLVMGTALNTIMHRSAGNDHVLDIDPKTWLREIHNELQSIFVTFDGAMMISGVLGIIHDTSGKMYYINAEHPYPVLYRAGQAQFLHEEFHLRKFGSPMDMEFSILEWQLQPGDRLILGSDGRDDLMLYKGEQKQEINEDHELFLRTVQEAGFDLHKILEHLLGQGDLSDDLSLMRIDYAPAQAVSYNEETLLQQIDTLRIKNLMQNKNYQQSLPLLHNARLTEKDPHKLRRLDYLHGLALYKLNHYSKAQAFFEKAAQHDDQPQALKLTAYCYYQQNQLESALKYLDLYLENQSDDPKARQNAKLIEKRLSKQRELLGQKQGLNQ